MSTRTDTLFPYTTLFRSRWASRCGEASAPGDPSVDDHRPAEHVPARPADRAHQVGRQVRCDEHDPRPPRGHVPGAEPGGGGVAPEPRSEEHTYELQSLLRHSYAVFCLKKKK